MNTRIDSSEKLDKLLQEQLGQYQPEGPANGLQSFLKKAAKPATFISGKSVFFIGGAGAIVITILITTAILSQQKNEPQHIALEPVLQHQIQVNKPASTINTMVVNDALPENSVIYSDHTSSKLSTEQKTYDKFSTTTSPEPLDAKNDEFFGISQPVQNESAIVYDTVYLNERVVIYDTVHKEVTKPIVIKKKRAASKQPAR